VSTAKGKFHGQLRNVNDWQGLLYVRKAEFCEGCGLIINLMARRIGPKYISTPNSRIFLENTNIVHFLPDMRDSVLVSIWVLKIFKFSRDIIGKILRIAFTQSAHETYPFYGKRNRVQIACGCIYHLSCFQDLSITRCKVHKARF